MKQRQERKGRVCTTKSGMKINLKGTVKWTQYKTRGNQILNGDIHYPMVEHLIKQLFSGTQKRIFK